MREEDEERGACKGDSGGVAEWEEETRREHGITETSKEFPDEVHGEPTTQV